MKKSIKERFSYFWYWHGMEIVIVSISIALITAILYGTLLNARAHEAERKAFMFECTKEHKEYECTAMWRAGEKKTDYIVIQR